MNRLRTQRIEERDYCAVFARQKAFTDQRGPGTPDELWWLEHTPVYTLGLAGRREHILFPERIPVIETDRGGQVTYHGPGQLVVYLLLDLKRLGIPVKKYVYLLEQSIIDMLSELGVSSGRKDGAPGVYTGGKKIAALGIRIRRGCCYHGVSLNIDMDLNPFRGIHPCGYPGMEVTQLSDLGRRLTVAEAAGKLIPHIAGLLGYKEAVVLHNGQPVLPAGEPVIEHGV